jgi:hypothetical protein
MVLFRAGVLICISYRLYRNQRGYKSFSGLKDSPGQQVVTLKCQGAAVIFLLSLNKRTAGAVPETYPFF